MKMPKNIKVYGDIDYRGHCPLEAAETSTFFSIIRVKYPRTLAKIATHIRNESKRNYRQAARHKAEGMVTGASDIIIPGSPSFVCEMKRRDHTKSRISQDQQDYLNAAQAQGAFACVALGHQAALDAVSEWVALCESATKAPAH